LKSSSKNAKRESKATNHVSAEVREQRDTSQDAADSESDMSVVLDPTPRKKRKSENTVSASGPKTKTAKSMKKAPKQKAEQSPAEEKMKLLQSQLLKCGIRKIWGIELKKFETDKEKIAHMQQMLHDVGMTGRFSEQKAKEIKEQRELASDLQFLKDGDSKYGHKEDNPPERRVAKGLAEFDWLADQSESE